jgi:hypothetical protein
VEHQNGHGYPYIDVGTRSFNGFSIHPSYLLYPNRLLIATKESAIAIMVNTLQIRMLEEITASAIVPQVTACFMLSYRFPPETYLLPSHSVSSYPYMLPMLVILCCPCETPLKMPKSRCYSFRMFPCPLYDALRNRGPLRFSLSHSTLASLAHPPLGTYHVLDAHKATLDHILFVVVAQPQ